MWSGGGGLQPWRAGGAGNRNRRRRVHRSEGRPAGPGGRRGDDVLGDGPQGRERGPKGGQGGIGLPSWTRETSNLHAPPVKPGASTFVPGAGGPTPGTAGPRACGPAAGRAFPAPGPRRARSGRAGARGETWADRRRTADAGGPGAASDGPDQNGQPPSPGDSRLGPRFTRRGAVGGVRRDRGPRPRFDTAGPLPCCRPGPRFTAAVQGAAQGRGSGPRCLARPASRQRGSDARAAECLGAGGRPYRSPPLAAAEGPLRKGSRARGLPGRPRARGTLRRGARRRIRRS